ncbi:MAG: alkylphosphonate utilization protein [Flavobacteriaceae bacterium]|jgi:alkylphosphonate utilization operon protein PhnA|nr:alkylphosphonate utilization protein [Flavobacteriaceae bacterium]
MEVKDCNGALLKAGDSVIITKTLKPKGVSSPIKMGAKIKSIRLTDSEDEIEGKVNNIMMVIRTEFVKKA